MKDKPQYTKHIYSDTWSAHIKEDGQRGISFTAMTWKNGWYVLTVVIWRVGLMFSHSGFAFCLPYGRKWRGKIPKFNRETNEN